MLDQPPNSARRWYALIAAAILLLALGVRLTALERLPVFVDEGTHLQWAQQVDAGDFDYSWLMEGKLLLGLSLAGLQVLGPGALWLGRAGVALISLPATAACIAAGAQAGGRRAGLLAGGLYALLPYAVFHERQVLADPAMAAAGSVLLVCLVRLARSGRARLAAAGGLALAASALFKLTGLFYLAPLAGACLWLPQARAGRPRLARHLAVALLVAAAAAGVALIAMGPRLGTRSSDLGGEKIGFIGCPPAVCGGDPAAQIRLTGQVLTSLWQPAPVYLGLPLLVLAGLAWPLSAPGPRRRAAVFLLGAVLSLTAVYLAAAKDALPARYLLPVVVPLTALAAVGLDRLALRLKRSLPLAGVWLAVGGLLLVTLWPFTNSVPVLVQPEQARLPALDVWQYRTGPYAGTGFNQAAAAILFHQAGRGQPARVLVDHPLPTTLAAYFDRTQTRLGHPLDFTWSEVLQALAQGQSVYAVDEVAAGRETPEPFAIGLYPRLEGRQNLRVRAFDAATPAALAELFPILFDHLENFRSDYEALAAALALQTQPSVLVAYPPNQLGLLNSLLPPASPYALVSLGGEMPWSLDSVQADLERAARPGGSVDIVFWQETRLDPQRQVETWLNTHLFRRGERWFGPLRWVRYAGQGSPAETLLAGARFGDQISLERVEVVDPAPPPGSTLRLRLHWQTAGAVERAYKVFVHLFAGDSLLAQYDGQPVGELRPTTTWRPGEAIVDAMGIDIPLEAPAGEYQIRVGLYDLATQERLPAQLAGGAAADFWVGGEIRVP